MKTGLKKLFFLTMTVILTISLLAACGGGGTNTPADNESTAETPGETSGNEPAPVDESEPSSEPVKKDPVTLTIGTLGEEDKIAFEAVAKEFQKTHPHVSFEYLVGTHSGNVPGMAAAGNAPDIYWLPDGFVNMFKEQGLLAPLNDAFDRMQVDLSDVSEGMLSYGLFDGQYYFSPRDHSQMVTFVNKTLLENEGFEMPQDGWTWEEFVDISRAVTKKDANGNVIQTGNAGDVNWLPNWTAFALGLGGYPLANEETRLADFSRPETVEAFRTVLDLMKEGVMANEYAESYPKFEEGKAAFFFGVRPHVGLVVNAAQANGFDWDVISFPVLPKQHAIGSGTSGYGVYPGTKHLEDATDFAAYLLTKEGHKAFSGNMLGAVPVLKSLQQESYWKEQPELEGKNVDAFMKYIEFNVPRVTDLYLNAAGQAETALFGNLFAPYMKGEKSLEDICKELDEKVNALQKK
ncbi:ABC transporter substrate-binding protein [Paenibacillus thermotolerans]|uniref:ABC transporter substrate-binding protein n=1 Tax=Paenibacillus thermotolerans TaxID=3027807 RepID=UPI002368B680|nr:MULTISPECIES: extracellular solute-binding protein [unclassified Paenibacillus]